MNHGLNEGVNPKIGGGKPPKMDGENNEKPYENGWFGGFSPYFWVDTQMPFQILGLSVSVAADWRLHGWLDGRVCRTLPGYLACWLVGIVANSPCWVTCWSTYLLASYLGRDLNPSPAHTVENLWSTIYLCRFSHVFPTHRCVPLSCPDGSIHRISPIYQSLQLFICRKGPFWIFTITLGGTGIWIHPNYRFHMAYSLGCTISFHASQKNPRFLSSSTHFLGLGRRQIAAFGSFKVKQFFWLYLTPSCPKVTFFKRWLMPERGLFLKGAQSYGCFQK